MSDLVGNPEDRFSRVEAHFSDIRLSLTDALDDQISNWNYCCYVRV